MEKLSETMAEAKIMRVLQTFNGLILRNPLADNLPNQTLPVDSLALSWREIQDIIAFIKRLTDTAGLTSKPNALPSFDDLALNRRKIGGEC